MRARGSPHEFACFPVYFLELLFREGAISPLLFFLLRDLLASFLFMRSSRRSSRRFFRNLIPANSCGGPFCFLLALSFSLSLFSTETSEQKPSLCFSTPSFSDLACSPGGHSVGCFGQRRPVFPPLTLPYVRESVPLLPSPISPQELHSHSPAG